MSDKEDSPLRGRNTTYAAEAAYDHGETLPPFDPGALPEADSRVVGAARVDPGLDGFHQPTALFDEGEFLGELAEVVGGAGETRAAVNTKAPPQGCRLIVVAGPDLGEQWAFKAEEIILGRDEGCDLPLFDIAVSREHARIRFEGESFTIEDLGSGNGSFVNGLKIDRETLHPGDEIIIGERTLRFIELNEAPPTQAAQPSYEPEAEPSEEAPVVPSEVSAPAEDSEEAAEVEPGTEAAPHKPGEVAPGQALRRTLQLAGVAALLLALLGGGLWWLRGGRSAPREARRAFLQGVQLVKARRFGDAKLMFQRSLSLQPGYGRAEQYKAAAEAELERFEALRSAEAKAAAGDYQAALNLVAALGPTAYQPELDTATRSWRTAEAERLLSRARARLKAGDPAEARALMTEAAEIAPWHRSGALAAALSRAAPKAKPARRARPRSTLPAALRAAQRQYRAGEVDAAIATAEETGGEAGRAMVRRMSRVRGLIAEASRALRRKDGKALASAAAAALSLDRRLSGGAGGLSQRIEPLYARGLYLRAMEHKAAGQAASSLADLQLALKLEPKNPLARPALAAMEQELEQQRLEAEAKAGSDLGAARAIYRRLLARTPPGHRLHKQAARWLKEHP